MIINTTGDYKEVHGFALCAHFTQAYWTLDTHSPSLLLLLISLHSVKKVKLPVILSATQSTITNYVDVQFQNKYCVSITLLMLTSTLYVNKCYIHNILSHLLQSTCVFVYKQIRYVIFQKGVGISCYYSVHLIILILTFSSFHPAG